MKATLRKFGIPKPEPAAKPYTCIKCGAAVYIKPDHHAYVCQLYRERRELAR